MTRRTRYDTTGIERRAGAYRAYVSQGRGAPMLRQTFPLDTPISVIQAWREDAKAQVRVSRKVVSRSPSGAFDADVLRYLRHPDVKRMPSYPQRSYELQQWIRVFGNRRRDSITAHEIRAIRDQWATEPRSDRDSRPLTPASVNKRLRALSNLYRVLDGYGAPNPARNVDELREAAPRDRSLDRDLIRAILDAMPDRGRPENGHRSDVSKAKARLRVMAMTGLPSGTLAKLTPADVDLKRRTMRLPARQKGAGVRSVTVPITKDAVAAFQALTAANAWGQFSAQSILKSFKRAAKKVAPTLNVRVYDLRHSFGTELAKRCRDEVAVAHLMQHASIDTTRKYYTSGSVSSRAAAAIKTLDR